MLQNRHTGQPREVDVVIRLAAAGHEALIKIEARASRRAADSVWVESQLGKHEHLPSGTLVLVSEAGFTRPARDIAAHAGTFALEPQDLGNTAWLSALLRGLSPLQPLWVSLVVQGFEAVAATVDGGRPERMNVPPDAMIFGEDANAVGTVVETGEALFNAQHRQVRRLLAEHGLLTPGHVPMRFAFDFDDIKGLPSSKVFLQTDTSRKVVYEAAGLYMHGVVRVEPFEIRLEGKRLGDVEYISGRGIAAGLYDTLVVTSGDETKVTTTVQVTGDEEAPEHEIPQLPGRSEITGGGRCALKPM